MKNCHLDTPPFSVSASRFDYEELGSQRDHLESLLLNHFEKHIQPLSVDAVQTYQKFSSGNFATSILGHMLYTNGYNLRGQSSISPNGLYFYDGEHLFGIGIFKKRLADDHSHIMIVDPQGPDVVRCVDNFIQQTQALLTKHDRQSEVGNFFVRHLDEPHFHEFKALGYHDIDHSPWDPEAPQEDEQENHKLILLRDIIQLDPHNHDWQVKALDGSESRSFRHKARLAYNRFENFLERNNLSLVLEDYTHTHQSVAESIVIHHFDTLKNPVGSTPEDYFNIVRYHPNGADPSYFGKIAFLRSNHNTSSATTPKVNIPISLFIGAKTDAHTLALYATFALRDVDILAESIDSSGFSAISQFIYLRLFKLLVIQGIKAVNVGGSETEDLDRFKRQLGARHEPSFWVVK